MPSLSPPHKSAASGSAPSMSSKPSAPQTPPPPRKAKFRPALGGMVHGAFAHKSPDAAAGPASKKRAAVYMDSEDEDEDGGRAAAFTNGIANHSTPSGGKRKKMRKNGAANGGGNAQAQAAAKTRLLQEQRAQLPIAQGRDAIVRAVAANDVTIVLGETGSGKTTQIPQYLLEAGTLAGLLAITQPRRVAATSLAARVSQEQGRPLGTLVGYAVRFDEKLSDETRVKYLTDGMLMREMMGDPMLERYGVVIVDEAHERTLRTDLVLASLKRILKERNAGQAPGKGKERARNPLKVVVMSATLDAEKFSRFFDDAPVLYVKGRQHPVSVYHTATSQTDYVDAALRTFYQIHVDYPVGDVLIFLPGQEDIESLELSIRTYAKQLPANALGVLVCPLYASLPNAKQSRVFAPTPAHTRKCILATNIAETSITIPGVKYVIDTGKQKEKRHLTRMTGSGFDTLLTTDITKSSAMQRAGRAGREGPGNCFRLYTEDAFDAMALSSEPEVRRSSLTSALLQLKCTGQDLESIDFMDNPEVEAVGSALRTLWLLDAIDVKRQLTAFGRSMASFPLEPQYAAILLASVDNKCVADVISILSLLSSSSPLFPDSSAQRDDAAEARLKFRHPSGDHLTMLNVFRAYDELSASEGKGARRDWCRQNYVNERALREAGDIRTQLRGVCERTQLDWAVSCGDADGPVLKSLTRGLLQHAAFLQPDGSYKQTLGPSVIKIHPSSFLTGKPCPAIIYNELVRLSSAAAVTSRAECIHRCTQHISTPAASRLCLRHS
ncbi:P-loop containing nucleoside triphosphate hydrolase protein [Auriscalpium vulgare]|uniref:P-loop containing nucleoside triphosphate hydrolase protein n=1 Tax=Auriscalpium vulgare TaxID=40419 RepID=A0ACB8S418_9AGAM|nr:P-loop containing nucleoside triphosphate hydrolase protein [Auriscalpium vulgare]